MGHAADLYLYPALLIDLSPLIFDLRKSTWFWCLLSSFGEGNWLLDSLREFRNDRCEVRVSWTDKVAVRESTWSWLSLSSFREKVVDCWTLSERARPYVSTWTNSEGIAEKLGSLGLIGRLRLRWYSTTASLILLLKASFLGGLNDVHAQFS